MDFKITKELSSLAERTQKICRAINHPIRLKILKMIDEAGELKVSTIQNLTGLMQSETSQHLRILREAGWVSCKRNDYNSKFVMYFIDAEKYDLYTECFSNIVYGKSESN